ncbi:hypothetical protein LCGC14_0256770 [marine sediment metagenome]|uniref:Uncharacterized protein n=1 Tax=marine sediment metagenome TaxID=412755 RepID=A0A0F9WNB1_9ZZZZ
MEFLPGIAAAIAVAAAAVGAAIAAVAVMAVVSEPFGGWREAIKYPPALVGWIIAASFAAWLAAKIVLLNL